MRFEQLVLPLNSKLGPCTLWQGAVDRDGYGVVRIDDRTRRAHVVAWERHNGRMVPTGGVLRHACDVPSCINVAHLSTGTQADNLIDAARRGRLRTKLTPDSVRRIRRWHASGLVSVATLAREHGLLFAIDHRRVSCWHGRG
jgi:hypothetical protein